MNDPDGVLAWLDSIPPTTEEDAWGAVVPIRADMAPVTPRAPLRATPFAWRAEADIPPRRWLYGKHLIRRFVSLDIAAGGIGKSSVKVGEALAMASGRDLYSKGLPAGPLVVWLYNLEDPAEETERRIHAAAKRFRISEEDVAERLYADSGRDQPLILATETPNGAQIATPVVDALIAELTARAVDVLVVDPFVSSHQLSENDNRAIDMVVKQWAMIADRCDCSINLVHHVRKQNGTEATADSARGASSLIGAARSVMVYNRMTKEEAELAGVAPEQVGFYFRVQNDKANLAPADAADWYRMNNVDLDNGDQVGVACRWEWPDTFAGVTTDKLMACQRAVSEGEWRESPKSDAWVGIPVARVLGLSIGTDRGRLNKIIKQWLETDVLAVVERKDSNRIPRKFVQVGTWVSE